MKKSFAILALGAVAMACSDQATSPQAKAVAPTSTAPTAQSAPSRAGLAADRRAVVQVVPDNVVGVAVGSCVGFDILADWTAEFRTIAVLDKAGNPAQTELVYRVTGQTKYYNSLRPDKLLYGGPGEGQAAHLNYVNGSVVVSALQWKVVVPGVGPIFIDAGEITFDLATDVITHEGGHHQYYEGDFAALCQSLTP